MITRAVIDLDVIIAWITSHFGKNPMNGGIPPNLKNKVMIRDFSMNDEFSLKSWLMWNE